ILIRLKTGNLRAPRPGSHTDLGGCKTVGMVQRDMPRPLATHGKASQQDALTIDVEALLDRCNCLEHIRFTSPVVACAIYAAEYIELDLPMVGHRRSARARVGEPKQEFRFSGLVLAAVHPHVQPRGLGGIVRSGQRYAIRLHRTVDGRIIGMRLLLIRGPWRL